MSENRRRKDSAKLVWDTKPKRAPNPRDIEFQTAEIVVPNPKQDQGSLDLPLFAKPQSGVTSLFPGQFGELPLGGFELDKTQMNRLIWGDNLLAMQALLSQGYAGKVDLIYIDPPFLSSADYTFQVEVAGQQVEKEASIIERLAYTDTWEGGMDSFLDMIYPRLQLIKRLLSDNGSIYLHIDSNASHYIKILMDEVFGESQFRNEIVWKRTSARSDARSWGIIHDTLFFYSKNEKYTWNKVFEAYDEEYLKKKYTHEDERGRYRTDNLTAAGLRSGHSGQPWRGYDPAKIGGHWKVNREAILSIIEEEIASNLTTQEKLELLDKHGFIYWPKSGRDGSGGVPQFKKYMSEGVAIQDIVTDIPPVNSQAKERLNYPTQKPEALLERIIKASSNEGDLIADFFCGSGTTISVAERLNRRWIGCNLDKVGLQVSRNRMVNQGAKPFLLENIGNYQRHMIYLSGSKIGEMQRIMLKLYGAEPRSDRTDLGVRTFDDGSNELVYVGYPDRPVTAKRVMELAQDAQILDGTGYTKLVILAWDYDYNYSTEFESRKKALREPLRVNIQALTIPPEIYNYLKKAKSEAELDGLRDKIMFHEKPYLKVSQPEVRDVGDGNVIVSLQIDRYVLMSYPIPEKQQAELKKAIKDNFAALIDYWAVDWDYDGITFKSTWQAIRGNGKRAGTVPIIAESPALPAGRRAIAVRLVDVFGNDASATVEVKN